ncbi:MAG: fluoride efflux transporter CrcB [Verrucomicrobiales bacterium]|nr:fluoride efflux transporter CrcB [Verrucomicrobiales bacterium]
MRNALLVFCGGGLGSVLRYFTILGTHRLLQPKLFPAGVLVANVLGCLVLGFISATAPERWRQGAAWPFVTTGMLGGFTTFSTWSHDSFQLFATNATPLAWLNLLGSVVLGLGAAALGWLIGRQFTP